MAGMTNDDALSLLNKMDVEQKTLSGMWDQFSVALRQVGSVIEHFEKVQKELPALEKKHVELQEVIGRLGPDLENRKQGIAEEEAKYRESLQTQSVSLRNSIASLREELAAVTEDLKAAEKDAKERKEALAAEIVLKQNELGRLQAGFESFRKQHGL